MTPTQRQRAVAIQALIRAGWNPPVPNREQTLRMVEDIADIGNDSRHVGLGLTAREERILMLVAEGDTANEIAEKLGRSPETIRDQERRIRRKLGAKNNTQAVAIALRAAA